MIVSDSTTLIILHDVKKFTLLENIFDEVIIPKAVYNEISFKEEIVLPSFMKVLAAGESQMLSDLCKILDCGESEAIALAKKLNCGLIIDEKKGRKIAQNMGIDIIGLLGIVYQNIKIGTLQINDAKKFLKSAKDNGYRINQTLIISQS